MSADDPDLTLLASAESVVREIQTLLDEVAELAKQLAAPERGGLADDRA